MGAGSSVEEIPGGGTEGYHVLRVKNLIVGLCASVQIPTRVPLLCTCKQADFIYCTRFVAAVPKGIGCLSFCRCKIIPRGIKLAWSLSLISLWLLKIRDW